MTRGILARGLVLQADPVATEAMHHGKRCERRFITLDVEVEGAAPYFIRLNLPIPRIVEALPGATLDLRVNPSDAEDIEILGPAGACGWLNEAAAVPGQTWGPARIVIPDSGGAAPTGPVDDDDVAAFRSGQGGSVMVAIVLVVLFLLGVVGWVLVRSH